MGKNRAGPFFPHPDKIKYQPGADGYLGGEKLGWSITFPPWQVKASTLPCHEYANNLCFLGGGGKTGPAHSFPTLTIVSSNLVQKLGYLGGEKLSWSITFPPWQVKASILPCHEYTYKLCLLGGGKILGRPSLSPPWLVEVSILLGGGEKLGQPIQDKASTWCRWLSGWRKTRLVHYFSTLRNESINLTLSWIHTSFAY